MKVRINDYNYEYDEVSKEMAVIPNENKQKPTTFFKYYNLGVNSVDALTNLYVYATHPNQLNDPFDCNDAIVTFSSKVSIEHLCGNNKALADSVFESYGDGAYEWASKIHRTILYRKLGILSLTETWDNLLLWSHYSKNDGFCIEFDTVKFPFNSYGPFPINYCTKIEKIDVDKGGHLAMLVQTNQKSDKWSYENEWRLLISNPAGFDMMSYGDEAEQYNSIDNHNRRFKYPLSAIKSITFGFNFFEKSKIIIGNEIEYKAVNHTPQQKILNFIVNLKSNPVITSKHNISLYLLTKEEFSCKRVGIEIVKIENNHFRIIEID